MYCIYRCYTYVLYYIVYLTEALLLVKEHIIIIYCLKVKELLVQNNLKVQNYIINNEAILLRRDDCF